jgi:hypothetical protein
MALTQVQGGMLAGSSSTVTTIQSNGTTAITIDASQNVGIGTTPSTWNTFTGSLQIAGASLSGLGANNTALGSNAYYNSAWKYYGTGSATLYQQNAGQHTFQYAGSGTAGNNITFSTAMLIDGSGNVGIGTTTPANKVHIQQTSAGASLTQLVLQNADNTSGTGSAVGFANHTSSGLLTGKVESAIDGGNAYSLRFYTYQSGLNEGMRITAGGNLLIGISTTPLPNNTGKITTYATSGSTAGWVSKGNANGYYGSLFENQSDTTVGYIQVNSTTTNFSTTSDYRLKENVAPMTGALATVTALKPCTYKWKIDGSDGQGFIAHELQSVVPECVSGEKDAVKTIDELDAEGKVIGTKEMPVYQGIDTSFLVATLTAAIQEQQVIIDALKARLDTAGL